MTLPRSACNNGNISINQSFLNRHPVGADRIRDVSGTNPEHACEALLCNIKVAGSQYVLQACLIDRSVGTQVHYPIPLHLQQADAESCYKRGDFPIAEKIADKVPGLPIGLHLSFEQQHPVIAALLDFQP